MSRRHWAPFLALETSTLLSAAGNGIAMIAFPWLVLDLTGKASDAGLVAAVSGLPLLLTALIAGTVVDRVGRRRTSVGSDLLSAVSVAAIPLVGTFGELTVGWLMALGAIGAVFDPAGATARTTMLPEAARAAGLRLERANGVHEAIFSTAFFVAPGVGGLLIASVGALTTLWATTLCFLGAAALLALQPMPSSGTPRHLRESHGFLTETRQGLSFVWHTPAFRAISLVYLLLVAIWLPIEGVVLPVMFQSAGQPRSLGVLLTAMSAGTVVGSLAYGLRGHRIPRRAAMLWSLLGTALPIVGMALLPPLPWMLALGFLSGLMFGPVNPLANVVMQEQAPEAMRGRVLGVFTATAYAAGPLGLLAVGPLVDRMGTQGAFLVLAVALTGIAVVSIGLRGLHDLETPKGDVHRPNGKPSEERAAS